MDEAMRAQHNAAQRERGYQRAEREIAALRSELAERTAERDQGEARVVAADGLLTAERVSHVAASEAVEFFRDRADAAERKLADVLRRVREFVSKILAEPTVERQVRAMIPEAFEPQGEGDDNDDR